MMLLASNSSLCPVRTALLAFSTAAVPCRVISEASNKARGFWALAENCAALQVRQSQNPRHDWVTTSLHISNESLQSGPCSPLPALWPGQINGVALLRELAELLLSCAGRCWF